MNFDFTVLIPNYNTPPDQLFEAVYSMLNQSYPKPFKILIVDDGSTRMDTLQALETLKLNPKINVHMMDVNGGTSAVLNKGHELIDSKYIAIMGADDISHKNRIETQVRVLEANPKIDVCGTNLFAFYSDDMLRKSIFTSQHPIKPVPRATNKWWLTNHGTVIYKNESVKKAGGYDLTLRRAQDVDLWRRMYEAKMSFHNCPEILYAWRRRR